MSQTFQYSYDVRIRSSILVMSQTFQYAFDVIIRSSIIVMTQLIWHTYYSNFRKPVNLGPKQKKAEWRSTAWWAWPRSTSSSPVTVARMRSGFSCVKQTWLRIGRLTLFWRKVARSALFIEIFIRFYLLYFTYFDCFDLNSHHFLKWYQMRP